MLSPRSRPYRELGLADRAVSDDELLALMSEFPALIRRPLVAAGDRLLVGFDRPGLERIDAE